ncbi:GNAT family N-acetyltransferase [Microvirga rosea]|uniref:GNAT family N-acetyltransferase n=1 Tax=Microvirga rosea TaxID=2715425 RepID=UPI001D0AA302|nr:GNAT family N-acetyltransferase [Microvirga rosea]MCB8819777.1 GNAT family N-acetyltransferase [Microvirga rosea]
MIRVATAADAGNLAALSVQVWLHTYAKQGLRSALSDYVLEEFTAQKLAASIDDKNQVFFVYEENAHLVGYLRLLLNSPSPTDPEARVEIARLYVQEHFLRRGIGRALLQHMYAYCARFEIPGVWLAVNHENTRAIRFYEQHRFERTGSAFFHLDNERHENFILYKPVPSPA